MTMTAAELTVAREFLGLTGGWIATAAGYSGRTERRWEAGDTATPDSVRALTDTIDKLTGEAVSWLVHRLQHADRHCVLLLRDDTDYQAAAPAGTIAMPARWHHHLAARAALTYPGTLVLAFDDEPATRWLRPVCHIPQLSRFIDTINYAVTVGEE
jgi:hypothetical protein